MKIALFSHSTIFGGVEKIVVETANELSKTDEILLIIPRGCLYKDKVCSDVQIYEYKSYDKRYNLFLYFELFFVLKKFQAEILHSHGTKATQISFIISKFLPFKFIATKHNNRKGKIFNRVSNVIAVSKAVAKTIKKPCKVIYFGINPKDAVFTITAVGRLDKIKGFDILIDEVSKLKFDFILQIVGDGKERENLQNQIKRLNLQSKVKLLGFRSDIRQILANSHLQVISSRNEGLPITLIEGIFYTPIVLSTPVGGISEILDDEFLSTHTNLGSKIEQIYKNYDYFKALFTKKHESLKQILTFQNYILELRKYYLDKINKKI
ncbi:glycosyltransferase, family 1 [Campylobacter hyointestinalis subsp. lawsonii CCUG 27631]|uniref:glycosyltransferase n=1 Tax=Campylobacter hyointestinalis TaxID=198 RepID=UPI0007C96D9C|nr:glycosyltransferase [Campylobacter hyointestinalis]ANE33875.1 glycosyltransferase, family 1 [Campylobacter hyointestinalis subsp. lawsonii CCUG 27631]